MRTLTALIIDEPGKVLVAGDWHGNTRWMRQALTCAARDGYRVIIHVGT